MQVRVYVFIYAGEEKQKREMNGKYGITCSIIFGVRRSVKNSNMNGE